MQLALRIVLVACLAGSAACILFLGIAPYVAAFYRRRPGCPWLQATFVTTLMFHPEWYQPRGRQLRQWWIMCGIGAIAFACAAAVISPVLETLPTAP
jgi:formate hydrogenlyase subunit 4